MKSLACITVLLSIGCGNLYYPSGSYNPGPPPTIWMMTTLSGGRQCDPLDAFIMPDVASELEMAGILLYAYQEKKHPVCRACGCSTYSAHHYVQVDAEEEQRMRTLGFELASPPSERE